MNSAAFKTALITGITGYLGKALAARLLGSGIAVHAIVRPTARLDRLAGLPIPPVLHRHDGTLATIVSAMTQSKPDVIFHLAGHYVADHTPEQVEPLLRDNVLFGAQVLEAARCVGVNRFVNVGSYAQNADPSNYRPLNLYAAAKQAFEDLMAYYADACGMATITLRLYYTYGPNDWRGKLMEAIRKAQKAGTLLPLVTAEETMDIVHVDDAVAAFVCAAELLMGASEQVSGRVFAVRPDQSVTVGEIVAAFEREGGTPVRAQWGAYPLPARRITAPWRGPLLPGWRAEVALTDGIRSMIAQES